MVLEMDVVGELISANQTANEVLVYGKHRVFIIIDLLLLELILV